jgi:hypothetical protein
MQNPSLIELGKRNLQKLGQQQVAEGAAKAPPSQNLGKREKKEGN